LETLITNKYKGKLGKKRPLYSELNPVSNQILKPRTESEKSAV